MQGASKFVVLMEEDLKGLDMASVRGVSRKDDRLLGWLAGKSLGCLY